MKFTINCDCTPEEARAFFGLPDFAPMQEAILSDMQEKMQKNLAAMDPENLMQMWMPQGAFGQQFGQNFGQNLGGAAAGGMQAFSELQKAIWDQMMGAVTEQAASPSSTKKRK